MAGIQAGKVTKAELVDSIYERIGMERYEIKRVAELFCDEIKSALIHGKTIELRGFGTFEIRLRKGRHGARNPKTGEKVDVPMHGVAAFKAGKEIKEALWNYKGEE
ncbi:MAG: integration host factor subunit beta [Spirochaetaceae bacterium]|jgi:integration host factor subunit beta|nr:integration host factor subunit beta [Spirochaetaceae bacterium]